MKERLVQAAKRLPQIHGSNRRAAGSGGVRPCKDGRSGAYRAQARCAARAWPAGQSAGPASAGMRGLSEQVSAERLKLRVPQHRRFAAGQAGQPKPGAPATPCRRKKVPRRKDVRPKPSESLDAGLWAWLSMGLCVGKCEAWAWPARGTPVSCGRRRTCPPPDTGRGTGPAGDKERDDLS